jgi:hypothetical protein
MQVAIRRSIYFSLYLVLGVAVVAAAITSAVAAVRLEYSTFSWILVLGWIAMLVISAEAAGWIYRVWNRTSRLVHLHIWSIPLLATGMAFALQLIICQMVGLMLRLGWIEGRVMDCRVDSVLIAALVAFSATFLGTLFGWVGAVYEGRTWPVPMDDPPYRAMVIIFAWRGRVCMPCYLDEGPGRNVWLLEPMYSGELTEEGLIDGIRHMLAGVTPAAEQGRRYGCWPFSVDPIMHAVGAPGRRQLRREGVLYTVKWLEEGVEVCITPMHGKWEQRKDHPWMKEMPADASPEEIAAVILEDARSRAVSSPRTP